MIEIREYEQLAKDTGAFKDIELDMLKETLQAWKAKPGEPFTLLDLRDGRILAGFAVLARAPDTDFTYDVRAICIERAYIGTGVGKRLIEMVEEEAMRVSNSAIVRFETSRRKEDAIGRGVFTDAGYLSIGHIADFYEAGDDYFIYAKHLHRAIKAQEPGAAETGPAAASAGGAGAGAASAGDAAEAKPRADAARRGGE
ncbi:MAG TPA: GNAT family N-acetyltransferase [Rectinemataceae bacterium]|nr:GNAT family N-acetyltransferase [Rectinemataceae bacterium]